MATGGWIHPHVMDCFGMLTTTDQIYRYANGKADDKEIRKHMVIKECTVSNSIVICFFIAFIPSKHALLIIPM
jgi:hypothetical protein